ncbi:ectoine hydroxylase [Thauera sp.]|jgi:ectoine hydroxylase|uniref:ectoine hydroxylase n=1 Tax=Thauera sp. TaxID=1905334 RepID=UPI002A369F58|nr:ectoine hydroxylase [Thauera sp.]MDX9886554.1 ectoine hydroxylase [Thauera sp.]
MTYPIQTATGQTDRYPSRIGSEPSVLERQDPIVYGRAEDGPLDSARLTLYEKEGFLSLESFFSTDEIQAYLDELARLRDSRSECRAPEAIIEPDSGELRSIFAIHKHNAVLRRLCMHPRLVAIARQLLGGPVYIHQSRINYKSGFRGREFYWHSDFETWHVEDGLPAMRTLSCSVSLTPNTEHNGPLMVIPGSHRKYVACVGETPEAHYVASLRRQEYGVPDEDSLGRLVAEGGIVAPKGSAGSVTFFDCNLMHGSNSNITPLPRSNVFIVFNSVDNRPQAPFCGLPPRPPFIAEREDFRPVGD